MVIGQQTPASACVRRYSSAECATWPPGRFAVQASEWTSCPMPSAIISW